MSALESTAIMARVDKVILVGGLGRDPEIRYMPSCRTGNICKQRNGREHAPMLSISDEMPESGGGGGGGGVAAGVSDGPDAAAGDDDGGEGDGDPDRRARKPLRIRNPKLGNDQRSSSTSKRRDGAVNNLTQELGASASNNAPPPAGELPSPQSPDIALWRLPTVLAHVPVSRSHWWAGVAAGRYPAPVKLSKRCVAWRSAEIRALIASF